MRLDLPENAEFIIKRLETAGFEAYVVGGCVRDMLMGREVNDFDITTSSLPEETKSVFSDLRVLETGIKHGTVTVMVDGQPFEVTTFRVESGYSDSRHPDSVTFVREVYRDLARRDFTVNAIAYSPSVGIVDPHGGREDIEKRVIRAVGDPYKRFSEDALRILRALRFSSTLGFQIEAETAKAINTLAHTVKSVSGERIYTELNKLLLGKNCQYVIDEYIDAIRAIIPANGDFKSVSRCPGDAAMRLYCLCGEGIEATLSALRADNRTKHICRLLSVSTPIPPSLPELKLYISSLGRDDAEIVVSYRKAVYGEDEEYNSSRVLSSNEPLFISDLAIKGNDLLALGLAPKQLGAVLASLLRAVINEEINNSREELLEKAKEYK
ncbi:MAG: CCA tRNA nucleotidyltransferase [Clostridia bacterium]|nr:CCA tRNA nucleotidyltransferase [Clostridia bacterium]